MTRTLLLLAFVATAAQAQTAEIVDLDLEAPTEMVDLEAPAEIVDLDLEAELVSLDVADVMAPLETPLPDAMASLDAPAESYVGPAPRPVEARLQTPGEIIAPPAERVSYVVRGRAGAEAADLLVRLAAADGLRSLSAETTGAGTSVSLEFGFASAEAWAAWQATPATQALLGTLQGASTTLHVERRR